MASSDAEIAACYPVLVALRPHIGERGFVARIRSQEQAGYRLAFIRGTHEVVAVAGFRLGENLAWGRFLYVDDLVTHPDHRSRGHGTELLDWLKTHAAEQGCAQIHLDSGLQRTAAHRFYEGQGLTKRSFHFSQALGGRFG
jgi:ribosomal protein S18 acetylase RimI-like enzyme